jgi:hypothetical protein
MPAAEIESCRGSSARGGGIPSFLWNDGRYVSFRQLKERLGEKVRVMLAYQGTNQANCDAMEAALHQRHFHLPKDRRLFRRIGMGSCWPGTKTVARGAPYPYYCATLLILCSLEDAGLRLGEESDRKGGKKKRKRAGGHSGAGDPDGAGASSKKRAGEHSGAGDPDGAGASSKRTKAITDYFPHGRP